MKAEIGIDGQKRWTLFESGARHNDAVRQEVQNLPLKALLYQKIAGLCGREHQVTQVCLVIGQIDGHWVEFEVNVVDDEIDKDERVRLIEVIFGAPSMRGLGIELDIRSERLDFGHCSTEFVEFRFPSSQMFPNL